MNNLSKKQIIFGLISILIIVGGLVVTIILVRQQQSYKARAEFDINKSFEVTGNQAVSCQGTTCTTNASAVHIKYNPQNTQDLLNSLP